MNAIIIDMEDVEGSQCTIVKGLSSHSDLMKQGSSSHDVIDDTIW